MHAYMFEESIHTGVVLACFDAFCQTITKKTVVVIDNASIHTSDEFEERLSDWKKHGLIIKYLSPCSPELNLIEIPLASHQIHLVTILGLCVSERVERGVGNHPEPCRIRISNYFCLGT